MRARRRRRLHSFIFISIDFRRFPFFVSLGGVLLRFCCFVFLRPPRARALASHPRSIRPSRIAFFHFQLRMQLQRQRQRRRRQPETKTWLTADSFLSDVSLFPRIPPEKPNTKPKSRLENLEGATYREKKKWRLEFFFLSNSRKGLLPWRIPVSCNHYSKGPFNRSRQFQNDDCLYLVASR